MLRLLQEGSDPTWSDTVISEYTGEGACAPCRMVKKGTYKYIYTHGYPDIMYNLKVDPDELNNIAEQEPEKLAELKSIALDNWNPDEINKKVMASQKKRLMINKTTEGEPTWAYMVLANDDERYVRKTGAIQTKAKARLPRIGTESAFK